METKKCEKGRRKEANVNDIGGNKRYERKMENNVVKRILIRQIKRQKTDMRDKNTGITGVGGDIILEVP